VWIDAEIDAKASNRQTMSARLRGVIADVTFVVEPDEHESRQSSGIQAFTTVKQLLGAIQTPAPGASDRLWFSGSDSFFAPVASSVSPPVTVSAVSVHARSWRDGFSRISAFAGYAERTVVLPSHPRDSSLAMLEGSYFGVGLVVADADGETTLSEPAPFTPQRFTLASWLFAEQVYREWITTPNPASPRS
jgi:hypothetical protein